VVPLLLVVLHLLLHLLVDLPLLLAATWVLLVVAVL
jgi:hypothetical protein